VFKDLAAASRFYDLTNGGIHAQQFSLTPLGHDATGADEVKRDAALKKAVLNVPPYAKFFEAFKGKKVPQPGPFREYLLKNAEVPEPRLDEAMGYILEDAVTAGLLGRST
jgi:hypothetical protein